MLDRPTLDKVKYLSDPKLNELAKKVQAKVRLGYDIMGPLQFLNNEYVQVMYKLKIPKEK